MRAFAALLFFLLLTVHGTSQAQQPVQQNGVVTPGHVPAFTNQDVIQDGGPATNGNITNLGITSNGSGLPFCLNDYKVSNSSGYHQLCFSPNLNGQGFISYQAQDGAAPFALVCDINGTTSPCLNQIVGLPIIDNNAVLAATSTAIYPSVIRAAFTSAGDAPPLLFYASQSPCSLNSGAGDNGSQVASVSGGCWVANFSGPADIREWGAVPGASNNSTAAMVAAAAVEKDIYIPPIGTFYMNATLPNLSGALIHGTWGSTLSPYAAGDVLDLTGGNFVIIRDISLLPQSFDSGSGIVLSANQSNTKLEHVDASNFPAYGVSCQGSSSSQISGDDISDSNLLGNLQADAYWSWCNDFHITGSNFGVTTQVPGYGLHLSNSGAGQVTDNFIWQNTIGLEADTGNYNWISRNRITQSAQQGVICNTCNWLQFQGNQLYQNSNSSIGGYESAEFIGGSEFLNIQGNHFFDWSGVAHTDYSVTVDSSNRYASVTGNSFSWNTIASTNISASIVGLVQLNNGGQEDLYANACGQPYGYLSGNSSITAPVGGSGSSIYLGNSGASAAESAVYFMITAPGVICTMTAFAATPPGAAQTDTFTVRKNDESTGVVGVVSGTNRTINVASPANAFAVQAGDVVTILMASSAGASASQFLYTIGLAKP